MVDILNPPDILLKSISVNEQNNVSEKDFYFYHGDHLGSANWITNADGDAVQYIHYAPYGELIANQIPYGYDEHIFIFILWCNVLSFSFHSASIVLPLSR